MVAHEYPKLLAPKGDGEVLVWPEPRQLLRNTWENHRQLRECAEAKVAGVPVSRLRAWTRRWMGHREDHRPIIATGHQTELYHPGVWIKNVVIDAAARRIGGEAIHFAVDTDAPKHLNYRWPGGGRPITDDPDFTKARWSSLLTSPSEAYVSEVRAAAQKAAASWGYQPGWDDFFDKLASYAGRDVPLPAAIGDAHHVTDRALGLRHQVLIASNLMRTTGYLLFVYDICSRAEEYAAVYNAALAEFRRVHGIASPGRPMPDLACDGDWCEVPFWLDDLEQKQRKRASLVRENGLWSLNADGELFAFDPAARDGWLAAEGLGAWLTRKKLRISPRALTLTSFLRLAVVDQFVHGIGGAIYDQVTDRLLDVWYHIPVPRFSVATATLYFPLAANRERTCLECIGREGRHLKHGLLGERKMELVRSIDAAPRRSTQRAALFSQMHRELDEAMARDARIAEFTERAAATRKAYEQDQALFDREIPYTIQSRERLERMVSEIDERFR